MVHGAVHHPHPVNILPTPILQQQGVHTHRPLDLPIKPRNTHHGPKQLGVHTHKQLGLPIKLHETLITHTRLQKLLGLSTQLQGAHCPSTRLQEVHGPSTPLPDDMNPNPSTKLPEDLHPTTQAKPPQQPDPGGNPSNRTVMEAGKAEMLRTTRMMMKMTMKTMTIK